MAQAFAHWIISLPTQDLIASFQVNGSPLFTPDSVPYCGPPVSPSNLDKDKRCPR